MKILRLFLFFLILAGQYTFSQVNSDTLLDELHKELFPFKEDTSLVKISSICKGGNIGDDVQTFERQPDFEAAMNLLGIIISTKKPDFIPGLKIILDEYESFFQKNWEHSIRNKHKPCQIAVENLLLLQSIEEAILSLNISSQILDPQELFDYYLSVETRRFKYMYDKKYGHKGFDGFRWFSAYYRKLLSERVANPVSSFNFIGPYIDTLRVPLLAYLKNYYSEYRTVVGMEVPGFILYRVLNVVREDENSALYNELVNLLLSSKSMSPTEVSRNSILMVKNSGPNGLFMQRVTEQLFAARGAYKMNALLASSYICNPDFTDVLIDLFETDLLSEDEEKYLKRVLGVISKRAYISGSQLNRIKRTLDEN